MCFQKQFHRKRPVLESLFFLKVTKLYKVICSAHSHKKQKVFLFLMTIFCMNKLYFAKSFSSLTSQTSQKCNRSIVILQRTILWIFRKWFMKTWRKKKIITNTSIYTITAILKFYEVLFCTYCKGLFLKNSYYAYVPPYMNKTVPTLGNEKKQ